jgi:hypothetical protein
LSIPAAATLLLVVTILGSHDDNPFAACLAATRAVRSVRSWFGAAISPRRIPTFPPTATINTIKIITAVKCQYS